MWEVFNMGCGFCVVVPAEGCDAAVEVVARRHSGARRIGTVTGEVDRVSVPSRGVALVEASTAAG
jgi:phosphoribosylaminoimidazole (AIR) synthetase